MQNITSAMLNINNALYEAGEYSKRDRDRIEYGIKCGCRPIYNELKQRLIEFSDKLNNI